MREGLHIGVSMIESDRLRGRVVRVLATSSWSWWLVGESRSTLTRWNTKRNQDSQLRRGRILNATKTILTHVALGGLEETQTTRFLIGLPEEYAHGHTLPIMLTQIKYTSPSGQFSVAAAESPTIQKRAPLKCSQQHVQRQPPAVKTSARH